MSSTFNGVNVINIQRDGGIYQLKFEGGKTVQKLEKIGDSNQTGTKVRFLADDTW